MAIYVYGYAPAQEDLLPPPEDSSFLGLAKGSILALSRETDATEWSGPEAEANTQRIEWIGPRALHHETLVQWAHEHLPGFYPTSLGTVFSSLDVLDAAIIDHAPALLDFFTLTRGCSQWILKGQVDKTTLERAATPEPPASGADYLRRRQQSTQAGPPAEPLEDMARELLQTLRPLTRDLNIGEPRSEALRWHLLVPRDSTDRLINALNERIAAFTPRGLTLQLAGPMAPYHFRP